MQSQNTTESQRFVSSEFFYYLALSLDPRLLPLKRCNAQIDDAADATTIPTRS
jgi:hypothetical protein